MSHGTWPIFYYAFKPNQYGWKSSGRRLAVRWSKICFHQIVQYLSTCTCWAHLPRENPIFSDLLVFCLSLESEDAFLSVQRFKRRKFSLKNHEIVKSQEFSANKRWLLLFSLRDNVALLDSVHADYANDLYVGVEILQLINMEDAWSYLASSCLNPLIFSGQSLLYSKIFKIKWRLTRAC